MATANYGLPMSVGDRQVVRMRRVPIDRDFGGMVWMGFRLTHPRGRRGLSPDFPMRESAERYAKERGWRVLG
jgi:hypothetical protein